MNFITELKQLHRFELLVGALMATFFLCPGVLIIWAFSPEFIEKCNVLTLAVLAISITLPPYLLNFCLSALMLQLSHQLSEEDKDGSFVLFFVGGLLSTTVLCLALLLTFATGYSYGGLCLISTILEGIAILLTGFCFYHKDKFPRKKQEDSDGSNKRLDSLPDNILSQKELHNPSEVSLP